MNTALDVTRPDLRDFRVDGWLVQPGLNLLVRGETSIHVRPQLIDLIACLAVRPGAVVTKDQLLATVWSDRYVCESGVARCVAELRRILADDARRPRIIQTIPKRGYRLIAPVEHDGGCETPRAQSAHSPASVEAGLDGRPAPAPVPVHGVPIGIRGRTLLSMAAGLFAVWRHYLTRAVP